ncbi:MAG: hypothetical protein LC118_05080 [Dehalococcoidia bacterium]|nr:hypothetical protein [Dehalococcoidia bacterium]
MHGILLYPFDDGSRWSAIREGRFTMRLLRPTAFSLLFALAVLAIGACGGDDNTGSTPTPASSTASASQAAGTAPAASATTGTASAGSSSPADAAKAFREATSNLKNNPYKAVYSISQTDSAGTTKSGTLTLIQKGQKSYFGGTGPMFDASAGSFAMIDDGTNTYICTSDRNVCLKTKSNGGAGGAAAIVAAFAPDKLLQKLDTQGATVREIAGQTIAGRSAKCYSVTDQKGTGTACVDVKSGLLLSVEGNDLSTAGAKLTMKATAVDTSPADSAFDPPYPVQALPGQ